MVNLSSVQRQVRKGIPRGRLALPPAKNLVPLELALLWRGTGTA
jgi:hypothetical protein